MSTLFPVPRPDAARRWICLPCAGGGAADYARWRPAFPADVEILPARLPGREARLSERPYRGAASLVADLADAVPTDLPYVLYGHSMGAWLAFALARELRSRGRPSPGALHLAARRPPDAPSDEPKLGRLPRQGFLDGMQGRYGAIPDVLLAEPTLLDAFLPALRADVTLLDDWVHVDEPPLDVPFVVWLGADDRTVTRSEGEGWARHTTGSCVVREVPGGHFFHREPGFPARLLRA